VVQRATLQRVYLSVMHVAGKKCIECVAVYCSVLQCVAVCCSVLQCVADCWNVLQCVPVCCSLWQFVAVCRIVLSEGAGGRERRGRGHGVACDE